MEKWHALLKRQFKKCFLSTENLPGEWKMFIEAVNDAYHAFDYDRGVLEHSMELNEKEMTQINHELRTKQRTLQATLEEFRKTHEELKQAQVQLLQSEKMASIGQLAAGIAHEINNPVGFVGSNFQTLEGYIQSYKNVLRGVEELKDAVSLKDAGKATEALLRLEKIEEKENLSFILNDVNLLLQESKRGLERVKKIVMDLRIFSREGTDVKEPVKIETIIDSTLSLVYNELKYKAEIIKEYSDTPLVNCFPQRLGQVFVNLLVNAAHAIEDRGTITVRTYQKEGCVCVDISDTGTGIAEKDLQNIFDPFFTTKPVGQGTGLGLSISFDILQKHGGLLEVQSQKGEGATFTITLPVDKDLERSKS